MQLDVNRKLALVTAVLLPVLLTMGFWQLDREQEKISVQALYDERQQQAPVAIATLPADQAAADELAYLPVQLSGEYMNDRQFLLDNRMHESQPGYELITPFRAGDRVVLVNRGWLPMGPSRQHLPMLPALDGVQLLHGSVYVPPGETFVLSNVQEQSADVWPKVIQRLDIEQMAESLGLMRGMTVFPYTVRLQGNTPGALVTQWPVISMSPEIHRGYAVQWFTMAVVLLLLFLYNSIRRRET